MTSCLNIAWGWNIKHTCHNIARTSYRGSVLKSKIIGIIGTDSCHFKYNVFVSTAKALCDTPNSLSCADKRPYRTSWGYRKIY